jgi:hypothetical protein
LTDVVKCEEFEDVSACNSEVLFASHSKQCTAIIGATAEAGQKKELVRALILAGGMQARDETWHCVSGGNLMVQMWRRNICPEMLLIGTHRIL